MWNEVCYLGRLTVGDKTNEVGDKIKTITYDREVYCNEKSVKASEFYQAQAAGMKPEVVLEVMLIDYSKEKFVLYDDEEYTVLRTYKKSKEKIELTLTRGVNNATTT